MSVINTRKTARDSFHSFEMNAFQFQTEISLKHNFKKSKDLKMSNE